ncbi:hypothetical protein TMA_047 [Thermus phage TMA]|uniref:hypothetical protein n=1 Tax=Thermus phage TMA TaxID=699370 RepID=UPI00021AAE40|nr:hypothetical protein TMA_047 [Thermus phage TMA]BAK53735.1 hypothetical protein TMA_047 [Thermus phage TMA]
MPRKVKTEEIMSSLIQTNFTSYKNKNFFPMTKKEFFKLKKFLGKSLNLEGVYEFDTLYLPVNEILSLISQKEYWTTKELKLLDEQIKDYSLKYLVKEVANMI